MVRSDSRILRIADLRLMMGEVRDEDGAALHLRRLRPHVADASLQFQAKAHPVVSVFSPEVRKFWHDRTSPDEAVLSQEPSLDPWIIRICGHSPYPAVSKMLESLFLKQHTKPESREFRGDRKQGGLRFRRAKNAVASDASHCPIDCGDEAVLQRKTRHFRATDLMKVGSPKNFDDLLPLARQWPDNVNLPGRVSLVHLRMPMECWKKSSKRNCSLPNWLVCL